MAIMKNIFRVGRATLDQEDYLPPIDWLKVARHKRDANDPFRLIERQQAAALPKRCRYWIGQVANC